MHNVKYVDLIKKYQNYRGCPNMFRFTKKTSSGSHSQCLANIYKKWFRVEIGVVQTLSVLWRHSAAIALTTSTRRLSQL